ncbi:MAG: hypothetical protein ACRDRR_11925 [Pseudonocardiaceae bacterium]
MRLAVEVVSRCPRSTMAASLHVAASVRSWARSDESGDVIRLPPCSLGEGLLTGKVVALRRIRGLGGRFRVAISVSFKVLGPGTVSTTARTTPTGKAHR